MINEAAKWKHEKQLLTNNLDILMELYTELSSKHKLMYLTETRFELGDSSYHASKPAMNTRGEPLTKAAEHYDLIAYRTELQKKLFQKQTLQDMLEGRILQEYVDHRDKCQI